MEHCVFQVSCTLGASFIYNLNYKFQQILAIIVNMLVNIQNKNLMQNICDILKNLVELIRGMLPDRGDAFLKLFFLLVVFIVMIAYYYKFIIKIKAKNTFLWKVIHSMGLIGLACYFIQQKRFDKFSVEQLGFDGSVGWGLDELIIKPLTNPTMFYAAYTVRYLMSTIYFLLTTFFSYDEGLYMRKERDILEVELNTRKKKSLNSNQENNDQWQEIYV